MAYLSDEQQDLIIEKGLSRIVDKTITDPNALKSKLRKVREMGFAYSDQKLDAGARLNSELYETMSEPSSTYFAVTLQPAFFRDELLL